MAAREHEVPVVEVSGCQDDTPVGTISGHIEDIGGIADHCDRCFLGHCANECLGSCCRCQRSSRLPVSPSVPRGAVVVVAVDYSTAVLTTGVKEEAGPYQFAPSSSALATTALGDALVMTVANAIGFNAADYAGYHPRGSAGEDLAHQSKGS